MKRMRIFFTGVTGLVGQCLAAYLMRQGHQLVLLVRPTADENVRTRVVKALAMADTIMDWEPIPDYYNAHCCVVEGDLQRLPPTNALGVIDAVFHAGGDPRFSKRVAADIFANNLEGTENLLAYAEMLGVGRFDYIGAAYAHPFVGDNVAVEEEVSLQEVYVNPYTEAKARAEMAVQQWGRRGGGRTTLIYAPSIIIGARATGITTSFTGFARGMQSFYRLRQFACDYLGLPVDAPIDLPINVPGSVTATVNLVTVDYVTYIIGRLFAEGVSGVYHVTNNAPPTAEEMIQAGFKSIGLRKISIARAKADTPLRYKIVEKVLAKYLKEYVPFVSYNPHFSQKNVERVLKHSWQHGRISDAALRRMFEFAIACDFERSRVYKEHYALKKAFPPLEETRVG